MFELVTPHFVLKLQNQTGNTDVQVRVEENWFRLWTMCIFILWFV